MFANRTDNEPFWCPFMAFSGVIELYLSAVSTIQVLRGGHGTSASYIIP